MPDGDFVDSVRAYLHDWVESRLTVGVQTRSARARQEFASWCADHGIDVEELRGELVDIFVARLILHVKEDDDTVLSRQGCLDLLATAQRRAGLKLRLAQQILRLFVAQGDAASPSRGTSLVCRRLRPRHSVGARHEAARVCAARASRLLCVLANLREPESSPM